MYLSIILMNAFLCYTSWIFVYGYLISSIVIVRNFLNSLWLPIRGEWSFTGQNLYPCVAVVTFCESKDKVLL